MLTAAIEDHPNAEDVAVIDRGLSEHGEARSEPRNAKYLTVFLRDERGRVVGGLRGWTVWGWLEVKSLWIADAHRRKGFGTQLLGIAEREAVTRGCLHVWLDTFDFQAPAFYARLGYETFATLDDFPRGHTRYFLKKTLV